MPTVTSKDGTTIAYESAGSGPALVLVDGALCWRAAGVTPTLLPELAKHFTVYAYDRRGRGESTDTQPYANERELEDLEAVVEAAGGSPYICGFSSGAIVIMYAIQNGLRPAKVALFEAPLTVVDDTDAKPPADAVAHLQELLAQDRRGDMVRYFMVDLIGVPSIFMLLMKTVMRKGWNSTRTVAHTLPYDISFAERSAWKAPADAGKSITMPCAVIGGGASPAKLKKAVRGTAAVIPGSVVIEVPKQTHMIKPKPMTETLVSFFKA
ncbi:alpha/beta fold hydrolase [Antrihabitans stalactiti]|uniref:Alpha/beta hydrolase n=1 Tax=Antrihabitans stalactiti TaxID=2584121 RepID=A0A848K363_9NOCA|nr:alpha/beta hydrolase [Antrihabitans stalactiti]NMN93605.1 alpha/beta hydrolase [Antrihabitans stalactiti]